MKRVLSLLTLIVCFSFKVFSQSDVSDLNVDANVFQKSVSINYAVLNVDTTRLSDSSYFAPDLTFNPETSRLVNSLPYTIKISDKILVSDGLSEFWVKPDTMSIPELEESVDNLQHTLDEVTGIVGGLSETTTQMQTDIETVNNSVAQNGEVDEERYNGTVYEMSLLSNKITILQNSSDYKDAQILQMQDSINNLLAQYGRLQTLYFEIKNK